MKRRREAKQAEHEAYARENPEWASVASVPMKLADAMMYVPHLVQQLAEPDMDPNSAVWDWSHQVNDYRSTSAEELEKWAQERGFPEGTGLAAYELMMAGADSLPTLALAGGGKAAQLFGKALDALATGNEDLYQKKQAGQLGTTAGLTSLVSAGASAMEPGKSTAKWVAKELGPVLFDEIVANKGSLSQQEYYSLISQGYSETEAWLKVFGKIAFHAVTDYGLERVSGKIEAEAQNKQISKLQAMSPRERMSTLDIYNSAYDNVRGTLLQYNKEVAYYNDLYREWEYALASGDPTKIRAARKGVETAEKKLHKYEYQNPNMIRAWQIQEDLIRGIKREE